MGDWCVYKNENQKKEVTDGIEQRKQLSVEREIQSQTKMYYILSGERCVFI
jgi:hypothetical protein